MIKSNYKKTILQVVPALDSGGVERGTLEIAKKLINEGYNSIVVSSGGSMVSDLIDSRSIHINMDVASKNPYIIWRNAAKIAKIIDEYNVDILHARSRAPAWSCALAAKKTGIKFITTFHGIYNFNNFIKKHYNSVMTQGEIVIAVSNFVQDHILKNYEADPDRIRVIHRGVNHHEFSKEQLEEANLIKMREKYNVPENTPVILLPSRITRWKGQKELVEALIKIKHLNFYCIMAGDLSKHPEYVQKVKELICSNKMQSKIQIFGNEPDVRTLYGIADIVVSTSIEPEAFGRTIIEAQSMEKIVIASAFGGASETIKDGISGYHFKVKDTDDLSMKIEKAISLLSTKEADEMRKSARKSVADNFSLDKMLSSVISVYQEI